MQQIAINTIYLKRFQSKRHLFTSVPDGISTFLRKGKRVKQTAREVLRIIYECGKFNPNGAIQISQTELGAINGGQVRSTASRAIRQLCKEKLIEKHGSWVCKDGQMQREANIYIPLMPEEIANKILAGAKKTKPPIEAAPYFETRYPSYQNQAKQEVVVIDVKQTSQERLLQALHKIIPLIKEATAGNICEDGVILGNQILGFIKTQEKHDANRAAIDSKEDVSLPNQKEQIESETPVVVTEKALLYTSQSKSVSTTQANTVAHSFLCSKNATGIYKKQY